MFCADSVVNLLLNSGGKHHIEFKGIDGSFIYGANGELSAVPDSRSAIFKDRSLGLTEKNQLMRFFKLVQAHIEGSAEHAEDSDESRRIRDEDLERETELCKNLLKTKDGIESLALFHSSVGRYTNALGAMIYPIFGQGNFYKLLPLCSSQEILSQHLVINPSVTGPSPPFLPRVPNLPEECSESDDRGEVIEKVARGICIIRGSIFPPRSLCSKQVSSIRLLQLGSGLSKLLHASMNFLVAPPLSENPQDTSSIESENVGDAKPTLLWKATFVQELEKASSGGAAGIWITGIS
ncbi:hypothetical protein MKW92_048796 [Papaver armeniacum]|nr:hypothetical protein MKW92_048796 [Papaver armeniacum]